MNEILMIVNPKAGKAKPNKYVPKIIQNFNDKGYKIDVKYTEIKNNATKIIKNYNKDYKILIVYGGDGTLNEAIQGLYEINKKPLVGFIPFGTTNDFAKSLGVSLEKLNISEKIKEYKLQKVDTGLVQNNIFNYVVSFGMFSKASYATSRKMKNKFGRLAYIFNGIKEVFKYKTYDLKIEAEEKSLEGNYYQIMLIHEPILFQDVKGQANLVLAGHTLGGLINIPFIGGIIKKENTSGRIYR